MTPHLLKCLQMVEFEVYSFTTTYNPEDAPDGFEDQVPYVIALVKSPEKGTLITAQLADLTWHKEIRVIDGQETKVDVPDIEIGMPVEMVTRKLRTDGETGIIVYGYKFREPISSGASAKTESSRSSR